MDDEQNSLRRLGSRLLDQIPAAVIAAIVALGGAGIGLWDRIRDHDYELDELHERVERLIRDGTERPYATRGDCERMRDRVDALSERMARFEGTLK